MPDIYQGQEFWDFSLVDPDNRRPVDFAAPSENARAASQGDWPPAWPLLAVARQLAADPRNAQTKLFVTWRMLRFRRQHAALFQQGEYLPLEVQGPLAKHVCAFHRRGVSGSTAGPLLAIVVVPRWFASITPQPPDSSPLRPPPGPFIWQDTQLVLPRSVERAAARSVHGPGPRARGREVVHWEAILSEFPVALLTNIESS